VVFNIPREVTSRDVEQAVECVPVEGDLRGEYQRRLEGARRDSGRWIRLDQHVANLRLFVFCAAAALAFFVFQTHWPHPLWLSPALVAFVALVLVHEPVRRRGQRAKRGIDFYESGLARLDDRWAGTGALGLDFQDLSHPYAADLDLFGKGSLFERLCTARTRTGQETLARWLLEPADIPTLHERHQAVIELRPRLDLREDLELLGSDVRSGIDPQALSDWGKAPRLLQSWALRVVGFALAALGISAVIGWAFFETGIQPMLSVFLAEAAFAISLSARVRRVLEAVAERSHDLVLLGELLNRIEREPCTSPLLIRLRHGLEADGRPASIQIQRLARWVHLLQTEKNQFFAPLAAVLLWRTQIAIVIDGWRGAEGPAIAGWLAAVGQFEALTALAAYAAENPNDPFPEIVPGDGHFEAEGLGHPLIAVSQCVPNEVSIGGSVRALVVSGSNMSGKSTLLRAVGVAAVLAQAGAPVRARRLRISPLALGATLRIQDSLQAGKSRFYAEITRVREIVDLSSGPLPLLFLFDELFHGTNSHDRRIGSESVLRGLLARGAIGIVTTHDLALAEIVTGLGSQAMNVHFADQFSNGQMHFDYKMRPGVVEHSNALALMRAVGLEV
jgi:hypothetical protein